MALSLLAGTGKVPYQFTTLGQATTEFSKPLDGSGLFKNNPGTRLFCITSLFSPTAGQLGYPMGLSATSRVSWSLPSPQSPLAEDACPPTILAYLPRILPAVQAGLLDHTPPHPIPTSLVAGLGFSFWELRSDLNSPLVLTSRSGPEGLSASSSPSKAAPTPRCRETARFSALALPSCQVSALGRASLAGSPAVLRVVLGLTSSLLFKQPSAGLQPAPAKTDLINFLSSSMSRSVYSFPGSLVGLCRLRADTAFHSSVDGAPYKPAGLG